MVLAATAYLGLVAVGYGYSLERGFLSNDSVDQRLWLGQAAALGALSIGVALTWAREWRARTAVARLVIELSDAPAPDTLRELLARALDDPALLIAYPLGRGLHVDERGHSVELPEADGRAVTPLVRGGSPVAILVHRAELVDDPGLLESVGAAAGLALDRERLQAHTRAQLQQLRASRARTVEAGDSVRRQLERDLHDGAQQRLVVLSLALRLLRAELDDDRARRLDPAEAELRAALSELRELARGIYPAVLVDEGLATALDALAEAGPVPVTIESLPGRRLPPAVEAAAYFLVAEVVMRSNPRGVTVRADHADGRLQIEVQQRRHAGRGPRRARGSDRRARRRPHGRSRSARPYDGSRGAPMRIVIADDEMLLARRARASARRLRLHHRRQSGRRPGAACARSG